MKLVLALLLLLQTCTIHTQDGCGARFDLTLVIDSSGSIKDNNPEDGSYDNWNLTLTFMSRLVDLLEITDSQTEGVRVAAVAFSNDAKIEFFFHTEKEPLKNDILDTVHQNGNTNTSGALRVMTQEIFGKKDRTDFLGLQGTTDRKEVRDVALVITDGFSTWDNHRTIMDATAAKNQDITMFVIGVTKLVDVDEIQTMSSDPQTENITYWLLPDFQSLEPVVQNIASQICSQVNQTNLIDATTAAPTPTANVLTSTTVLSSSTTGIQLTKLTSHHFTTNAADPTTPDSSIHQTNPIFVDLTSTLKSSTQSSFTITEKSPSSATADLTTADQSIQSTNAGTKASTQSAASTTTKTSPDTGTVSPTALLIQDEALVIGVGVVAALLFILLIILLILCCCFKTLPCCSGVCGICANGGCCTTEIFCCCGSMFCCFCCAQWLLCCCCCFCWGHQHHAKISPATSEVMIIGSGYKDKGTNTSLVSVKVDPKPQLPPPPQVKTIEVCGKCMKELPNCICPREQIVLVPPPEVRPVYIPQAPVPQYVPHPPPSLPCQMCYGQYHTGTHCPQCSTHQCCQPHDGHCDICHQGNGRLPAIVDSSQVHLRYQGTSSSTSHRDTTGPSTLTRQYEKVMTQSDEQENRKRSKVNRNSKSTLHQSHDEYESHDSCSTRIFLVSDDQRSQRSVVSPASEGEGAPTERSYVYLPTDCPLQTTRQMSESLKRDFNKATAGK